MSKSSMKIATNRNQITNRPIIDKAQMLINNYVESIRNKGNK
jgi:hypothetical protein